MKKIFVIIILFFISNYVEASNHIEIIKEIPGRMLLRDIFAGCIVGLIFCSNEIIILAIGAIIALTIGLIDSYIYGSSNIGMISSSFIFLIGLIIRLIVRGTKKFFDGIDEISGNNNHYFDNNMTDSDCGDGGD